MNSFLDDLDKLFLDSGIDPETINITNDGSDQHLWMPIQMAVFGDDVPEWKCKRCGRTVLFKKVYPPEPPEPDYNSITDEEEAEKASEEYGKVMEVYESTKESLSRMETISEALKRENIQDICGLEIVLDISTR
jgi:hypothetical protein